METIVGIDVSKDRLDVAVLPQGEAFAVDNDDAGIGELTGRLKAIGADAIALEATGGFETQAVAGLSSAGLTTSTVKPADESAQPPASRSRRSPPVQPYSCARRQPPSSAS
jgi:transposase